MLRKFMVVGKAIRQLNCYRTYEMMLWVLGIQELTLVDCHAFFGNISLIPNRVMHTGFIDSVHVEFSIARHPRRALYQNTLSADPKIEVFTGNAIFRDHVLEKN